MGLHRLRPHVVADHLPQPLDELCAVGLLLAPAREARQRPAVEVVQDRGLPAGEHAGPHRAHVGVRQQVEHAQALGLGGGGREVGDRLGVVDVAPLRDVRHRQVVGDQELDAVGVGGVEADPLVELADEGDALGHVAVALGLADVVQEHPQHEQSRLLHLVEHLGGALGFRRLPGGQRLQVLDGQQRVLVGRELVIDVVLHQAGQRPELRQVAAEQSQLVHLGQGEGHPTPRPADVEEEIAHGRGGTEGGVDDVQRVLDGALEVERELAAEPVQVPEDLHDAHRVGPQRRRVAVGQVQPAVEEDQPVGQRLLPLATLGRAAARQRLLATGDEPARDAVDGPRMQVVVAHEALDAEGVALALVAEVLGDARLQVAGEHVVLVAGEEVQLVADAPQKRQRRVGAGLLARRDEAVVGQLAQRAGPELGRAQPHGGVHVAQAAGRLLDVGLADVGGGAELAVALLALGQRHGQELAEVVAVDVVAEHSPEAREELAVTVDEPRLLHRGPAGEVGAGHCHAVLERAQAVADLQAEIPQRIEQLLHQPLHEGRQRAVVDHHDVDVRRGMELAAPVAAERDDHERGRGLAGGAAVGDAQARQRAHEVVDEARVRPDGLLARRALHVHVLEGFEPLGEDGAEEFEAKTSPILGAVGARLGAPGPAIQLGRHVAAERNSPPQAQSNTPAVAMPRLARRRGPGCPAVPRETSGAARQGFAWSCAARTRSKSTEPAEHPHPRRHARRRCASDRR